MVVVSTALAANTSATLVMSLLNRAFLIVSTALAANTSATGRHSSKRTGQCVSTALAANTSATDRSRNQYRIGNPFQQP